MVVKGGHDSTKNAAPKKQSQVWLFTEDFEHIIYTIWCGTIFW